MITQSIAPKRLLQDSFTLVKPIYSSLLLLVIPLLILDLPQFLLPKGISIIVVFFIGEFLMISLILGASLFYTYQKLTHREVTVFESLQKAINKLPQILLSRVLEYIIVISTTLLLFFPGIYFSVRLFFIVFGIIIENHSATGAISRSWQLVKGRWWSVFWALLVMLIALYVPILLIGMIVASVFGVSSIELYLGIESGPAFIIYTLVSSIFVFFVNPMLIMYQTLMFMSLLVLERRGADTVDLSEN
jgi:hypothetical protein